MSIRCAECGKFISYQAILDGETNYYFEPDSYFGPEIEEHTHKNCRNDDD